MFLKLINKYHRSYHKIPDPNDFKWVYGNPPEQSVWNSYFIRNRNLDLSKDAVIFRMDYNLFKKLFNQNIYKNQLVCRNSCDENILLKASDLAKWPHETVQVKLMDKNRYFKIDSKIMHGEKFSFNCYRKIVKSVEDCLYNAKNIGLEFFEVEVAHVHIGFEFLVVENGRVRLFLSPLSDEDIRFAKYLVHLLPCSLRIKAISTSGINYSLLIS